MEKPLINVKGLTLCFQTEEGLLTAVDDVSFHINPGEIVGLVGESGCGKSMTSMSILQLIPKPAGKIISGSIYFENKDLLKLKSEEVCKVRGNKISMIFQEPMTSLNPMHTCGRQIVEAIRLHRAISKREAREQAIELLRKSGIPSPEQRIREYPHQLSGGMRQRVMIAMALACQPRLLIADEPTTALDVTIQAQILDLLKKASKESGMAILLITHELGIVAETADRIIVMYAGQIVEEADVHRFFIDPKHPYAIDLLRAIPRIDKSAKRLDVIEGMVPSLKDKPKGCRYYARCREGTEKCRMECPPLAPIQHGRRVACWKHIAH